MLLTLLLTNTVLTASVLTNDASAAEVTEIPNFLRGDVQVAYAPEVRFGSIVEGDQPVGRITTQDHVLNIGGSFGAAPGVALYFNMPLHLASSLAFTDVSSMVYDPLTGEGSMYCDPAADSCNGRVLDTSPIEGKGLGGVWLGVQGTPFSEAWPNSGMRATWLVDLGFRTADSSNFYTVTDGQRGAGPGGSAFRLRSAFSTTKGVAQPYVVGTWLRQNGTPTTLYDRNGAVTDAAAEVLPGSRMAVNFGAQVNSFTNSESGAELDFDFRMGFDYNSWQRVPSGLYLPSITGATDGEMVDKGEYSSAWVGLGMYWRMFEYLQLNIVADGAYVMPHLLEDPYPVSTGMDTVEVRGSAELKVRIR